LKSAKKLRRIVFPAWIERGTIVRFCKGPWLCAREDFWGKAVPMEERGGRQRRIIVDIDNTLWHLAPELWEALKKVNREMPPPAEWDSRKSIERFMPIKEFFRVLKSIHMQQEIYSPFPDAGYFLRDLKERGFYIVIASHRDPDAYEPTVSWMKKNSLAYDEIHLSYDKSVLFPDSIALIDDSPINLSKAAEAGILGTGLLFPWNENSGFPLFKTLSEVLQYLDSKLD
jgi:FMN phosphatase YigB (HAD superfamily)